MLTIAGHLIACLLWGIALASLLLFFMHIGIVNLTSRRRYSFFSVLVYIVCFLCLSWQSVRMVGAFYLKDYTDGLHDTVDTYVSEMYQLGVSAAEMKENLLRQYPYVADYIRDISLDEWNIQQDSSAVADYLNAYVQYELNWYIVWRIGYMLVIALLFSWLLTCTMKKRQRAFEGINWN